MSQAIHVKNSLETKESESEAMRVQAFSFIVFFIVLVELVNSHPLSRAEFPRDFIFGTSSSAYQYEGAANQGGRGPSIWDTFTHNHTEKIKDHSTGDIAVDSYHRYKEDVGIMKDIGFAAYRFSISWPRVLPGGNLKGGINREGITYYNNLTNELLSDGGNLKGGINREGITYYNNLINELLSNGLQPYVTLFHWDLPQTLEDEYGGFLSPNVVKDFADYVDLCYREFGDRVKHWITINEPLTYTTHGYASGTFAPGRCSNCGAGDSSTEPYLVAHHQILAHAAAVKVYRDKYQVSQKGQIGITLNSNWMIPLSKSKADIDAASRSLAFNYDWFMEPLNSGSYPVQMVDNVGKRLPTFTREQSLMVKGSFDFIGVNYYTSNYVANAPCVTENQTYSTDSCVTSTTIRNGVPIGPKAASDWLYIYPRGIRDLLIYTKQKYNNPVIYITENGVDEVNDGTISLVDNVRVKYLRRHLTYVLSAIEHGVNVKGYFAWSLLDNFEWADGYSVKFGLVYVDFKDGLRRYPKKSAQWLKKFLH